MIKKAVLLFLLSIVYISGFSQKFHYAYSANCKQAVSALLQLDYALADSLIKEEQKQNNANVMGLYLEAYSAFIQAAVIHSESSITLFNKTQSNTYTRLNSCSNSFPEKEYCKAHLRLMSSFIGWKRKDYLSAALDVKKSYEILSDNADRYPNFVPNQIGLGMINFLAGSFPDEYQWVTKIFGLKGSDKGITKLWDAYQFGKDSAMYEHTSVEAIFLLSYINTLSRSNENDISRVLSVFLNDSIFKTSDISPLVLYMKSLLMMKTGINVQVLNDLNTYLSVKDAAPIPQLYYLAGLMSLYQMNKSAVIYMSRFLSTGRNANYVNSARQKLAWYSLLSGDTANYRFHIRKISKDNKTDTDADRIALKEAEKGEIPNVYLLRSRIYFDGGNYNKSLQTLIGHPPATFIFTKKESLEYTYRLGRIYQEKKMYSKANSYFQITLDKGKSEPYYFAANSALQLAYYFEKQKDFEKAKMYYEQCLDLDYTEYRNSISHKARVGLKRIKQKG